MSEMLPAEMRSDAGGDLTRMDMEQQNPSWCGPMPMYSYLEKKRLAANEKEAYADMDRFSVVKTSY